MKCEHCGKNEVTFIYQSNINGQITEKHLCSRCAQELGYAGKVRARSEAMFRDLWGGSMFGSGLLGGFPSLLGRMDRLLEDPFDDFFSDMPALRATPAKQEEPKEETLVDQETRDRVSRQRQLNALRMEMKQAVSQEDFERAAQLRDQIRGLEAEENNKESA